MEKSGTMTDIYQLFSKQPQTIKKIIGPIEYAERLQKEGIIALDGSKVKILKPYSIDRINGELWLEAHNFFKPLFWRF